MSAAQKEATLNTTVKQLARHIQDQLRANMGGQIPFTLMIHGSAYEDGRIHYVSDSTREQGISMLKRFLEALESNDPSNTFERLA